MKVSKLRKQQEAICKKMVKDEAAIKIAQELNKAYNTILKSYALQLKYADLRGDRPELPELTMDAPKRKKKS